MQLTVRILIADRMALFRVALQRLLEAVPEFTVIGQSDDGQELADLAASLKPDVLLMDLNLCRCSGMEALRDVASKTRALPILLVDGLAIGDVVQALLLGARGVIRKDASTPLLMKAIRAVTAGEYWISRAAVYDLVDNLRLLSTRVEEQTQTRLNGLSPQQMQIIEAIVAGCSNKEIAEDLCLSERTVKYHLTRIFSELGVSGRTQLARFSLKNNLIPEA